MILKKMILPITAGVLLSSCTLFQKTSHKSATHEEIQSALKTDTSIKSDKAKDTALKAANIPKPYKDVITAKAITDKGLFTVHKIDDRYFFEIPDSLFEKDILIVNRITKAAANIRPRDGFLGYSGDEIGENEIQFCRGPKNKIFVKRISYYEISNDSSENGMYHTVQNSNLQPIVAAFDIKAFSPDSTAVVIDLTDYINSDNNILFFDLSVKKTFGLGGVQVDRSFIQSINSYPLNIEIRTVKTYMKGEELASYELNSSFILLPKIPMKPRSSDERVGYFAAQYLDFDVNPQGIELTSMITRWRLEPKDEDIERYKRGELVEPKKPIVFYIDPATPKKWIPYLIQGVNDWQKAFEKAGFRNAIYALEAPVNDTEWSLEDARHNAIIYKPSAVMNAYGPQVHDPRSGEILETHLQWFHNVMQLLHDWYFIQVSPNDPEARKMTFDDSLMGKLIRYVCSHEVGHTLGLTHNFGASSTIPVDSLRNKRYVEANGFCPSIMDYARFNYVAQPEDSISEKGLMPRIGVYDEWAIEWGYRWLPELKTKEEEKTFMNHWIIDKVGKDKRLWYTTHEITGSMDPRNQEDDIGEDPVKAGFYGIKNLKRIMPNLLEWTKEPNKDYKSAQVMQQVQIFNQYFKYLILASLNIGGLMENAITNEQSGVVYDFVNRNTQRSAVQFLQEELFTTPKWFINKNLFHYTGIGSIQNPLVIQNWILFSVMSHTNFMTLTDMSTLNTKIDNQYNFTELLDDLEEGIWKEIKTKSPIDVYRRNLQKAYIERLINLLWIDPSEQGITGYRKQKELQTDLFSIVKGHMRKLIAEINYALPGYKDEITKWHLIDVRERLQKALVPNSQLQNASTSNNPTPNKIEVNDPLLFQMLLNPNEKSSNVRRSCWDKWQPIVKY